MLSSAAWRRSLGSNSDFIGRSIHTSSVHAMIPASILQVMREERRIAWHVCHSNEYHLACDNGCPSGLKDDWITVEVCSPTSPLSSDIPATVLQSLRLARFSDRVASALGGSIDTPSGVPASNGSGILLKLFSQELSDLERSFGPLGDDITVLALYTRVRLSAFALQMPASSSSSASATSAMAVDCYICCMRILDLTLTTDTDVLARWPRPLVYAVGISCVTLLMIVTGPDARKFDVPAGLSRISDFYRITHLLTTSEGDMPSRFAHHLGYAARDAHDRIANRTAKAAYETTLVARYGLPNFLFEMINRAKILEAKFEMEVPPPPLPPPPPPQTAVVPPDQNSAIPGPSQFLPPVPPPLQAQQFADFANFSVEEFNDILTAFWNESDPQSFGGSPPGQDVALPDASSSASGFGGSPDFFLR